MSAFVWRTPHYRNRILGLVCILLFLCYYFIKIHGSTSRHTVTTKTAGGNSYTLGLREKTPQNFTKTVVLLHSDKLDSSVWENIKTLDLLYKLGYRAIAFDLPGFGRSYKFKAPKENYEKAAVLEMILKELNASNAILVVPSMSGSYALPLIVRGSLKLAGFVAIAPHHTEKFTKTEYSLMKVPTMIIYGSADSEYGEKSSNDLQNIPDSKIHVIKGASHACYLQNPDEFHEVLKTFLEEVSTGTFDSIRREQMLKKLESQHKH